jgi:Terminase large subunit, T4likevirus-type, N-terminal
MSNNIRELVRESLQRHIEIIEDPLMKAWRTGDLSYKVLPHQQVIRATIRKLVDSNDMERLEPYVLNISRRFGKTTMGLLAFIEESLRNPGHTYLFAAPTEGEAREIIHDVMPALIEDAPDIYRPVYKNNRFHFHNGSVIKIGGVFNGGETLRGRKANGAFLDEAAHIKQTSKSNGLLYVLNSVIRPQLLTTGGWCLIASTPPPELAHEYVTVYNQARANGRLENFTIYDNTSISIEYIEKLKSDMLQSDPTGSSWRREYLAEFAVDTRTLIIPNWDSSLSENDLIFKRPANFVHCDRIVSYDHGTSDLSVFLFGYWDYDNATLMIEKELVTGNGAEKLSTRELSEIYKETRDELWGSLPVYKEICDAINPQVIIDFNKDFGVRFVPPRKTNLEAMVNQTINIIQTGQIKIDKDNCPLLIQTLEQGTWKTSASGRMEFARLQGIGHCDAIAALVYMVRSINKSRNPMIAVPVEYDPVTQFRGKISERMDETAILGRAFNIRPQHNNRRFR